MKKCFVLFIVMLTLFLVVPSMAFASTYQISVNPAADGYYDHNWWSGGHYNSTTYAGDSIPTSYYYWPGDGGDYKEAILSFDLSSLSGVLPDDITSATLNLNITTAYNNDSSSSRGNYGAWAGGIGSSGTSYQVSTGTNGWTSYDFTDALKSNLPSGTIGFRGNHNNLPYDGGGFSFTSAEEGHPAYLEITTAGGSPVPIPGALWLFGSGLFGLVAIRRRKAKV